MITVNKLADSLNSYLDPLTVDDYGPNGIQVANTSEIKKIATAVSASLEVIEQAIALKANALIVHHGIFWKGESQPLTGTKYKKIKLLMDHNIALLCYHFPLDMHQTLGNNWKVARDLGWMSLEPFGEYNRMMIGVKGTFPACSTQELQKKLEDYYQHPASVAGTKAIVQSAAIVSGGAHKCITQAVASGVDCFITGTFDEPQWDIAREEGIVFMAFGHNATEKVGPKALTQYIKDTLKIPCDFIDTKNPF